VDETIGFREANTPPVVEWRPCGCVVIALGQGHGYLPCAKHEGNFRALLGSDE